MRGYATMLKKCSEADLKVMVEADNPVNYEQFGLSRSSAVRILRKVHRHKELDLVQLNTEVPRTLKTKLHAHARKRKIEVQEVVTSAIRSYMKEAAHA